MQIQFKKLSQASQESETKVFGHGFNVDEMSKPEKYLPRYQQNKNDDASCVQQCQTCCGQICILCAIPWGCCCCQNCCPCVYTLPTSSAGLVESFGQFYRLLKPGFNLINPCSQQVRQVDMRAKIIPIGRNPTITKDNVNLTIVASIAYRPTNPIISHYVLGNNVNSAIGQLAVSAIRQIIGQYNLQNVLNSRMQIAKKSVDYVKTRISPGLSILNIFLQEMIIPPDIQRDLTSAAKQRRISQANIINSKADVESASLMKQAAQLLDTKAAMQIRYLQMVQQLGKSGVVLILPIGANKKGFKH